MKRSRRSENQRAEQKGHVGRELWGARPLANYSKTAANKRLARRLERRRLNRTGSIFMIDISTND